MHVADTRWAAPMDPDNVTVTFWEKNNNLFNSAAGEEESLVDLWDTLMAYWMVELMEFPLVVTMELIVADLTG